MKILKKELYKKIKDNVLKCVSCAHECIIKNGQLGFCNTKKNIDNKLYSLNYGKIIGLDIDPIEKKPLYHFMPGTLTFSLACPGCSLKCSWCQNYKISQTSEKIKLGIDYISPIEIFNLFKRSNCQSISYTYSEPSVFLDYVLDVACIAKKENVPNILVSNGYFSEKGREEIKDYINAVNIDLKSSKEEIYKSLGGSLAPVLSTIEFFYKNNIHVEITTLIVPGINDTKDDFLGIIKFISKLDENIPFHISRYFPAYKYKKDSTDIKKLKYFYELAKNYGLKKIYIGNT